MHNNIGTVDENKYGTKYGHMIFQNSVSEVHGRLDPNHLYLDIC